MLNENRAIDRLTNVNSKVSCHYFIKRNGEIVLLVPELYTAWHAGKSYWKNYKSINHYSIGIEIQNKGHKIDYQNFSKLQIKGIINLSKKLKKKFNINKKNFLGHSDIAYNRKDDPGEKFPWKKLSKYQIGTWHNLNYKKLAKLRKLSVNIKEKLEFFKNLNKIGYLKTKISNNQKKLIKSFQRRYRQELINGKIDQECLKIAEKISKS